MPLVTLVTLVLNPVRPDSSVGRASGRYPVGPGFNPQSGHLFCLNTKNPEHHGRMKHLDLCFYWLRDKVEKKVITPAHLPTEDMPADLLTKPLAKPKVEKFRMLMGLMMNT